MKVKVESIYREHVPGIVTVSERAIAPIDPEDPEIEDPSDDYDWDPFEDEYEDWDEESYDNLYQNHNEGDDDDEDLYFSPVIQDDHADYWEAYSYHFGRQVKVNTIYDNKRRVKKSYEPRPNKYSPKDRFNIIKSRRKSREALARRTG